VKPKIAVIGLDAATMDLVEPWSASGDLPTLGALMRSGVSARLASTPNMHSASAWTSILTGLNPGRHGLFVFSDRDFETSRQMFFKGSDRRGAAIGEHLARHGLTAGFLNVPMTYQAEDLPGGYMVSGLDAPALDERAFSPGGLRQDLLTRFPEYNFTPPGLGDLMSAGKTDEAVGAWLRLIETQTAAAEYLLTTRPVTFFMTVYTASDWGGHNLWSHDPAVHGGKRKGGEDGLLTIYRALDAAIARLLQHFDEGAQVYIISDHGMGPHSGAAYHLPNWLERNGYLARRGTSHARASFISSGKRVAKELLPVSVKAAIKTGLGAKRLKRLQSAEKDLFYSSIDWARSKAYTEPGRHVININLLGRNPSGTVPATEYDQIRDAIAEDLIQWKDDRGVAVVKGVARREEQYQGPFVERASDMYVYWNPEAELGEPPEEVQARGFWWSGDHRPDGILICKGPGIRSGEALESATVHDLLPTVMHLAGLPAPSDVDGRVLQDVCTQEHRERNPIALAGEAAGGFSTASALTKEEEELIEKKLRGLGYL